MAEIQGKEEWGSLNSDSVDATNLYGLYERASHFLCDSVCSLVKSLKRKIYLTDTVRANHIC